MTNIWKKVDCFSLDLKILVYVSLIIWTPFNDLVSQSDNTVVYLQFRAWSYAMNILLSHYYTKLPSCVLTMLHWTYVKVFKTHWMISFYICRYMSPENLKNYSESKKLLSFLRKLLLNWVYNTKKDKGAPSRWAILE